MVKTLEEEGGCAFPADVQSTHSGMSLRDYFAARAMHAYASWALQQPPLGVDDDYKKAAARYARTAYIIADAMLKARQS